MESHRRVSTECYWYVLRMGCREAWVQLEDQGGGGYAEVSCTVKRVVERTGHCRGKMYSFLGHGPCICGPWRQVLQGPQTSLKTESPRHMGTLKSSPSKHGVSDPVSHHKGPRTHSGQPRHKSHSNRSPTNNHPLVDPGPIDSRHRLGPFDWELAG